ARSRRPPDWDRFAGAVGGFQGCALARSAYCRDEPGFVGCSPSIPSLCGRIRSATIVSATEIRKTAWFADWLDGLRDLQGRARVQARIERLAAGNAGDVRPVGRGVSELRIDFGPGYRVYFARRGDRAIVLLVGGD